MKPTIGRIVHFVDTDGGEFPGVITTVHSDTLVSLQVFRLSDVVARTSVQQDEGTAPGGYSWHWPQRA